MDRTHGRPDARDTAPRRRSADDDTLSPRAGVPSARRRPGQRGAQPCRELDRARRAVGSWWPRAPTPTALRAPRPEFTADLRERLMAEAETVLGRSSAALALPQRPRGRPRAPLRGRCDRRWCCSAAPPDGGGRAGRCPARRSTRSSAASRTPRPACPRARRQGPRPARPGRRPARRGPRAWWPATRRRRPQVPATLDDFSARPGQGADLLLRLRRGRRPAAMTDGTPLRRPRHRHARGAGRHGAGRRPGRPHRGRVHAARHRPQAPAAVRTCAPDLPALQVPAIFLASPRPTGRCTVALREPARQQPPVVVPRRITVTPRPRRRRPAHPPRGRSGTPAHTRRRRADGAVGSPGGLAAPGRRREALQDTAADRRAAVATGEARSEARRDTKTDRSTTRRLDQTTTPARPRRRSTTVGSTTASATPRDAAARPRPRVGPTPAGGHRLTRRRRPGDRAEPPHRADPLRRPRAHRRRRRISAVGTLRRGAGGRWTPAGQRRSVAGRGSAAVSRRRSGAASAACTASAGWSRAPGR